LVRKVFYSFHYDLDNWRTAQVRNSGVVEGNQLLSDNDWETVKNGGDAAVQRWIDGQLAGRSCAVVLIGAKTAGRKWINYEIWKAWHDGRGVLGVHIHRLLNQDKRPTSKGLNPFSGLKVNNIDLHSAIPVVDPPGFASTDVYAHIHENLPTWVDQAIDIRRTY
jgi:MTH538 TIR-like domain (DUF1863)